MMNRVLLSVIVLLLLLAPMQASPKQAKNATRIEQELSALIKEFAEALRQSDLPSIEKLLAPDYLEISPVGEVDPRDKVISFYQPKAQPSLKPEAVIVDEIKIRSYGEIAVVVARQAFKMNVNGQTREVAMRVTYVCRRQQGRWQLVSAQYTSIRPAPPKAPAQ